MGIVRKQSAYSSIFIYIGFAIGALNTLVLFQLPVFSQDSYGLTRLMVDFATFFSAMSTLGSLNALYKFTPFYKSYLNPQENDLPYFMVMANVLGCAIFIICALVFKNYLARKFGHNSPLFITHYDLVIPFTVSYAAFSVLEAFCWTLKKTIISNIAKECIYRLTVTTIILLYVFNIISLNSFFLFFSLSFLPSILILAGVVFVNGGVKLCAKISKVTRRLYHKILIFVGYHFSGTLINILPRTIDGILIAGLSKDGLSSLALYSIPVYLVALMDVPQRSMVGIVTALIADAWKNKDRTTIVELYRKSSLNLLIIGLGLFGLMYPNIGNLIRLQGGRYNFELVNHIFLILGLAKLVDLGLGMNAQILSLSAFWRVDFFTSLGFIGVNVILDYFLIKSYGALGAAFGGAIALVCYNLFRLINLWILYKIQPFSIKTLIAIMLAALAIGVTLWLPILKNLFLDGALRGLIFSIIFVPAIIYFNISEDITAYYRTLLNKISTKR